MISAASHHFRLPAIAFRITSCTFIIRSISADETVCSGITPSASHSRQADRSHANNKWVNDLLDARPAADVTCSNIARLSDRRQWCSFQETERAVLQWPKG